MSYHSEYSSPDGLVQVDVAILDHSGKPVAALEVDGPYHYSQLDPTDLTGSTIARNKVLKSLGWKVIVVRGDEWTEASNKGDEAKEKLVAGKLMEVGIDVRGNVEAQG